MEHVHRRSGAVVVRIRHANHARTVAQDSCSSHARTTRRLCGVWAIADPISRGLKSPGERCETVHPANAAT
eukprot:354898-Chlamydomonas_euryale.AAC.1